MNPSTSAGLLLLALAAAIHAQTPFAVDDFANNRSQTHIRTDLTPAATGSAAQCTTTGAQNIAVLTVTTPANPALPAAWSNAAIQQAYFAGSGLSLNTYWQDASYGQTSATGQVYGPFALSQNYDCGNLDALASAAITAAGSSVNFSQFTRIAIIFPTQSCVSQDLGAIGGYGSIGCYVVSPLNQNASVAWLPILPNWASPANSVGILAHEHGHNLGLNHSNTEAFSSGPLGAPDDPGTNTEYGDPYSVMGNADIRSTLPTFGQYTGQHKALNLNWLQQTEVQTSGTYTLAPYESSSGSRALRILRDPVAGSWLWAEYRQPIGVVDTTLSHLPSNIFSGILIHYENPELDSLHTYLLDYPASGNFESAALTPGQTWSDPYSPLTLTANSANSLTATYDPTCATLTLNASSITVTAPSTCSWTASTASSWITLTGRTSGTGNGTVPFSESANTSQGQRLGFITINRQSLAVIQPGTGISITGISPAVITGNSGQVSISLNDPAGIADIVAVYVTFSGPESCVVTIYPPSKNFALTNDAGNALLGPTVAGTLTNSVCSIIGAQSSVTGQGTQLTVTLSISFPTATFAVSHHMTVLGQNKAGGSSVLTIGTWTVLPPPTINPGGIVPVGSTISTISPGSWISIYGTNFSTGTYQWTGNYPTTLGGVSVTIDGKPAFLSWVGPGQINAQVPDDSKQGAVAVVVTTPGGTASSTVTLAQVSPSWIPLTSTHYVVAVIPGANGSYTIASATQPIHPGQTIELFGIGFGPTNPAVPAGQPVSVAAPTANKVTVVIGGVNAQVPFAGLIEGGLFQINVVIPQLSAGDQLLRATVGGAQTPAGVYLPID